MTNGGSTGRGSETKGQSLSDDESLGNKVHDHGSIASSRLFVGRLRNEVDAAMLQRAFSNFGRVYDVRIVQGIRHGRSKRFAFCDIESQDAAESAIRTLNGSVVLGSPTLLVAHSTDNQLNSYNEEQYPCREVQPKIDARIPHSPVHGHMAVSPTVGDLHTFGSFWSPFGDSSSYVSSRSNCEFHDVITTLYVRSLPSSLDEYGLYQLFGQYGGIVASKILRNNEDGKSRGEGFVEFSTRQEAEMAMASCQGAFVSSGGRPLRVTWAHRQLHLSPVSCGAIWTAQQMTEVAVRSSAPFGGVPFPQAVIGRSPGVPIGPMPNGYVGTWPRPPFLNYPPWYPQTNSVAQGSVLYPTHYPSITPVYPSVNIIYQGRSSNLVTRKHPSCNVKNDYEYQEEASEDPKVEEGSKACINTCSSPSHLDCEDGKKYVESDHLHDAAHGTHDVGLSSHVWSRKISKAGDKGSILDRSTSPECQTRANGDGCVGSDLAAPAKDLVKEHTKTATLSKACSYLKEELSDKHDKFQRIRSRLTISRARSLPIDLKQTIMWGMEDSLKNVNGTGHQENCKSFDSGFDSARASPTRMNKTHIDHVRELSCKTSNHCSDYVRWTI